MSTITKEWLLKTIAELEEERDAVPGAVNEDAAMAFAAMKLALASLEAEAMTQVLSSRAGNDTSTIDKALPEGTMLYTAPPAPVSVTDIKWPEEKFCPAEYAGSQLWEETEIWNKAIDACKAACRAAMLQGADGNIGKPLTIKLPDISSKAFWSGTGKNETFHPETYRRWVKEAIETSCTIARVDVEVK
ncbi:MULTISPECIES: hypothetical protein [Enterobacter cloacae complex]|uniref:hypothetical protein n=1 Tax=Enterobacter cloacae complex TaxID=354276 RepID=UPI00044D3B03|nr:MULTISPECIES: hypothetical protein [Enterobacter cloacae complex]EUM38780.1 hypothetical protein L406_03738 [Enterobacter sp. BWH 37]KDF39848.1 hypothetical protein AE41_02482 [Enterobacter hormaechei]KJX23983.1 hypothetical protein SG74_08515 [Enterobacter hormaechei subsp. xiangfangensis]KLW19168.1 hypothetical protein SK49_04643 [Enterobacter sp. BWH63]MDE7563213.1 hypothetical protein [Enterobacter hormaechei]